jgi:putative Holliday junction resolvase
MIFKNHDNLPPLQMAKFLGIDYGQKVIGLALYHFQQDPYPCPFDKIIVKNSSQVFDSLKKFIIDESITAIILGIPTLLDGKETSMTKKVYDFASQLEVHFPEMTIIFQDENLTTYSAEDRMKNSPQYNFKVDLKKIDALSACIIIEDFIDKLKRTNPHLFSPPEPLSHQS